MTVAVGGELDMESGPALRDRLTCMIWANGPGLALDLTGTVVPGNVVFSASQNYTVGGSGGISGTAEIAQALVVANWGSRNRLSQRVAVAHEKIVARDRC